jgi:3-hydroxyisobutyrate dehydrogenase-like beta-hydroxyacid dehydrogenase
MDVAVAGLGRMGTAIAERLLGAGHKVTVYNRTAGRADDLISRGARVVSRPNAVWDFAGICLTALADDAALEATALGPDGLTVSSEAAGKLLIDMSTVSTAASARVAARADSNGIAYLRAPVSGNPSVVRAGALGIVASGARNVFDSAAGLLHDIGRNVFYVGEGETARVAKLALNVMVAGTAQLLAECVTLAEAHGIQRSALLDVIGGSAVGSPLIAYKTEALVADDYSTTFSSRLMRKDLDLALDVAAGAGVPLPVTAMVQQLLQGCISMGFGEADFMALLPRLRREAGLDSPGRDTTGSE